MNNKMRDELLKTFTKIREVVTENATRIDAIIADAADENVAALKLVEPYRSEEQAKMRSKADGRIEAAKAKARITVTGLFNDLETQIMEWVKSPISPECAAVIDGYSKYGLTVTPSELKVLVQTAQGSYIGSRIVSEMAAKAGIYSNFVSLDEINMAFASARAETENAVFYYGGHLDEHNKMVSGFLGLSCADVPQWYMLPYAEKFAKDDSDTALTRFEKQMITMTEDKFDILPETRERLDEIFEGLSAEERLSAAKSLIDSHDSLSNLLEMYDMPLFTDAVKAIAAEKIAASNRAHQAFHDAYGTAVAAEKESATASQRMKATAS